MKKYSGELIGEEVAIERPAGSAGSARGGCGGCTGIHGVIHGTVVDETKMTLKIKQQGRKQSGRIKTMFKTIFKKGITLRLERTGIIIPGSALRGRPEERV